MSKRTEIRMPEGNQEGTRSVVQAWLKKVGDTVAINQPLLEISTDKVVVEIPAPVDGTLVEILAAADAEVIPEQILGYIQEGVAKADTSAALNPPKTSSSVGVTAAGNSTSLQLSPAVKKLIAEHHLNPNEITGTGKDGRITHEDVLRHVQSAKTSPEAREGNIPSQFVPHSPMRRSIASHMVESLLHTAPHVTAVFEADLTKITAHREQHRAAFEKRTGQKLTLTPYFVQATAKALRAVPEVNSRWHSDRLELFEECNIGLAVAIEGSTPGSSGLIVPVIRRAESLSLEDLAERVNDLGTRARAGKLDPSEVRDGTFTITNHGMTGSLIATPIIYQPQSAILGIGKLEKRAIVNEDDQIVVRQRCYITLTIDHRVLDGFTANKFLTEFVSALNA